MALIRWPAMARTLAASYFTVVIVLLSTFSVARSSSSVCNLSGVWHGHPHAGVIDSTNIVVNQTDGSSTFGVCLGPNRCLTGTIGPDGKAVHIGKLVGVVAANTPLNGCAAPPCTRINWVDSEHTWWCLEPYCEWVPPPAPVPPPVPPAPAPPGAMNVLFIACDDLRAQFGRSFQTPEVRLCLKLC